MSVVELAAAVLQSILVVHGSPVNHRPPHGARMAHSAGVRRGHILESSHGAVRFLPDICRVLAL